MTLNLSGTETVSHTLTRGLCSQWKELTTGFCLGHQKEHWYKEKNGPIQMLIHTHTHTRIHIVQPLLNSVTFLVS